MPGRSAFDYAIVRIVPSLERGECVNAGVLLFCRARRFLEARIELPRARLAALAPQADVPEVERHLALIPLICRGGAPAGPIGRLAQAERFHWLVAPRSTVIQPSPVHSGLCDDPRAALDHLFETLVQAPPPGDGASGGPTAFKVGGIDGDWCGGSARDSA